MYMVCLSVESVLRALADDPPEAFSEGAPFTVGNLTFGLTREFIEQRIVRNIRSDVKVF